MMMDNLSAHKGERVRKLIEGRGCELLYLPPYSPDLNPIEEAFSKIKRLLRVFGARTKGALVEAIGKALNVVSAGDARRFFTYCGYTAVTAGQSNNYKRRCNDPVRPAAPPSEILDTKSAAGGVGCTRLLGGPLTLGFKHLKKPAVWRTLQQTSKRLLQPWRDYGVGCFGILL